MKTEEELKRSPFKDKLFENIVVSEAMKVRLNNKKVPTSLCYFKNNKGLEVDLILRSGGNFYPFQIRYANTPDKSFSEDLNKFVQNKKFSKSPRVIYAGEEHSEFFGVKYVNYKYISKYFNI